VSSIWKKVIASGIYVGGDIIFWERTDSCRGRISAIRCDSGKLWVEPKWLALPAGSGKKYRWYEVLPRAVYLDRRVRPVDIGLGRLQFSLQDASNAHRPQGLIVPSTGFLLDFSLVHQAETQVLLAA
jgi:hypothetical protein